MTEEVIEAIEEVAEHGTAQRQVLIALVVGCAALAAGLYLLHRLEAARLAAADAPDTQIGGEHVERIEITDAEGPDAS